jgi:hypothetical protein
MSLLKKISNKPSLFLMIKVRLPSIIHLASAKWQLLKKIQICLNKQSNALKKFWSLVIEQMDKHSLILV